MSQKTIIGNVPVGHNVRKNVGRYFICTMIKDEHPYVREWALHHKKLGFDKIVLYDDGSSRPYDEEIGDLMADGFIEMRKMTDDRWSRQSRAFNEFVRSREWSDSDYCAFIDVDEFIFFDDAEDVEDFMSYYAEFAGVGLNWKPYNADGRISAPEGIPTPEAYTREFEYFGPRIKVIGRLKDIKYFPTVHYFVPLRGRLVTTNNRTVYGMYGNCRDFTNGHIKHYMTKSWEDWLRRLRRGNVTRGLRTVDMFFEFNPDLAPYKRELTKDLDMSAFPTLGRETREWDGDA